MLVGVQTYSEAGRMWSGVPQYSKAISYQDFIIEYFSKRKILSNPNIKTGDLDLLTTCSTYESKYHTIPSLYA